MDIFHKSTLRQLEGEAGSDPQTHEWFTANVLD
jgi:hypothetical protein